MLQNGIIKIKSQNFKREKSLVVPQICIKSRNNPQIEELFQPKKKTRTMEFRNTEIIKVKMAHTERYSKSAVPYMKRLINEHEHKKNILRSHEEH